MSSVSENALRTGVAELGEECVYTFPVTFAQQRLWFLSQLDPASTSYSIPWSLRLRGPLHREALSRALREIVERHEILRVTFDTVDGEPQQLIGDGAAFEVGFTDLYRAHVPAQERVEAARRMAAAEARQPHDLRRGPIFRARLLRLEPEEHVLLITVHHIVFDGWSRRIFTRELATLYDAFRAGRPSPLPALSLQYADYAVWQRKYLEQKLPAQIAYWKRQLAGAPAAIELPTDRPHPAMQTFRGANVPVALGVELSGKLTQLARAHDATPFMLLLAAFETLLYRYTGQPDILVGTPVANRTRRETEEMIGLFANTLVLRSGIREGMTFRELLAHTRRTALDAYQHQDVPFEKLVEELNPERDLRHNPIFQVLFSLQNADSRAFHLGGVEIEPFDPGQVTAKFELSLYLGETPEGLRGRLEYNADLFDDQTAERMMEHFETLLEAIVSEPDRALRELPLLAAAERECLLHAWNATAAPYPADRCVHQLIEEQAARSPNATACTFDDGKWTYRQLNEAANQLAHLLRRSGAKPGERIGVYLDRSMRLLSTLLGVMKSGAAYVPIDPAYPPDRIRMMVEDGRLLAVVTDCELRPLLPAAGATVIDLDEAAERLAGEPRTNPRGEAGAGDLVYVMFTSGSTGRPKGVEVTHRGAVNLLFAMGATLGVQASDTFPALTSFAFDVSVPELYLPLLRGGCVAIGRARLSSDGAELAAFLRRTGATLVQAPPTTWRLLLEAGFTGKGLRRAVGAEALPEDLSRRLLEADPSLFNFYGPTETTVWSTVAHLRSPDEAVTIGRPLANTQIYILDDDLQPVPAGVIGELFIAGDGVARGYLNRPDLTGERFLADPFSPQAGARMYRTGDRARYLHDGRIQYLGRGDHQVKVRGYRVELGEIENVLSQHAAVKQCVVAAPKDRDGIARLAAYVVKQPGAQADAAGLRAHVKNSLPEYMIPGAFVFLEALPLTPNGKINRNGLPAPGETGAEGATAMARPLDSWERKLSTIWRELLGIRHCRPDESFFELGGHSLLLVRMATAIEKEFGQVVPISFLFRFPTIEEIARHLREARDKESEIFVPFNERGEGPAFFCIHSITGEVNSYRHLAELLDKEQRFYGIQLPAELRNPKCAESVEALAGLYVDRLLAFEPQGPYILGGWSAGTPVALEMAQQLRARGQEVALLVAMDAAAANTGGSTDPRSFEFFWRLLLNFPGWVREDLLHTFSWRRVRGRIRRRAAALFKKVSRTKKTEAEIAEEKVRAFLGGGEYSENARAYMGSLFFTLRRYHPKRYDGQVLLFKAKTEPLLYLLEADRRWKKLADHLEIYRMAGTHVSILEERHVATLAAHLNVRLRECRQRALAAGQIVELGSTAGPSYEDESLTAVADS